MPYSHFDEIDPELVEPFFDNIKHFTDGSEQYCCATSATRESCHASTSRYRKLKHH